MRLDERSQKAHYLLENTVTRASQAIFSLTTFLTFSLKVMEMTKCKEYLGLFMQLLVDIQFKLDQSDHSGMSPGQVVGINLPGDSLR